MPNYLYTAKNLEGEKKTGTLSAKDAQDLARSLKNQGLILIKAELKDNQEKRGFSIPLPFLKVSLNDKILAVRNLQTMISAGLSLVKSLDIIAGQSKRKKLKNALLNIKEEINKGRNFSEALAIYPDIFSEIFQSMIKVGEESGTLEKVLKTLTLQMEKEKELKSRIKGALIYPTIIIIAMFGVGTLMLVFVVPQLSELFKELEVELPFTTQIVIGIGNFLAEKWYAFIAIVLLSIFIFWRSLKSETGRKLTDTLLMKIPIISSIIKKSNSASITRTISSLISSGVPIVRSLEVISGTLKNFYFKKAIKEAAEKVKKGERLSSALKPYQKIFPYGTIEMFEVGEETGETDNVLIKLADFFEEEVANTTKNLTAIIEPILMLIIGTVIGFFAISMIQPMYSILQSIK